jgi:hypothetical protein
MLHHVVHHLGLHFRHHFVHSLTLVDQLCDHGRNVAVTFEGSPSAVWRISIRKVRDQHRFRRLDGAFPSGD